MKRLLQFFIFFLFAAPAWAMEQPEVQITDVVVGTGKAAEIGARVKVHYTGWTMDGKQFDSSRDSDSPFQFSIGAHEVIRGWDIGVQGMRVGGKRELIIPPELGYGKRGYPGAIPPNATLKFEVELLEVGLNQVTWVKSNEELAALIARGVPVIDLRRPSEWEATGVIEGSKLITAFGENKGFSPTFVRNLKAVVGKKDEFVMIDSNGRRSSYLSEIFADRKGYTSIYNAVGGIEGWIAEGRPVVKP